MRGNTCVTCEYIIILQYYLPSMIINTTLQIKFRSTALFTRNNMMVGGLDIENLSK